MYGEERAQIWAQCCWSTRTTSGGCCDYTKGVPVCTETLSWALQPIMGYRGGQFEVICGKSDGFLTTLSGGRPWRTSLVDVLGLLGAFGVERAIQVAEGLVRQLPCGAGMSVSCVR